MADGTETAFTWNEIKDVVALLFGFVALVIGFLGLKTWRMQIRSSTDNDIARRYLISLLRLQDDVVSVRWKREQESLDEYKKRVRKFFDSYREELTAIEVCYEEMRALWKESMSPEDLFNNVSPMRFRLFLWELEKHFNLYIQASRKNGKGLENYSAQETQDVLFKTSIEDDKWGDEFAELIQRAEAKIRPRLGTESFWNRFL